MKNEVILEVKDLSVYFDGKKCIEKINLSIEKGKVYSIIGPNGCGKTTLIRAMSRSVKPSSGSIYLESQNIFKMPSKEIAKKMTTLYQVNENNSDITVKDLVNYGRFAHRSWWKGSLKEDKEIVDWAIDRVGLKGLAQRKINTLSGGERQRAWIAMSIAQKPKIFLLDEPTTYLDISHQLEILELVRKLSQEEGITVVMVLHDINHAARYSEEIIMIKDHEVYKQDVPEKILNSYSLKEAFHVEADIFMDTDNCTPLFFPRKSCREVMN